ncbi:MAG: sigma-70 family RNA polymerase sigma factor [Planctomycetota bacterium]
MSSDADDRRCDEEFVALLSDEQFRLLRYIAMLLGDFHAARNVLQETNLVLWRKASDFRPGTNFSAWARKIAYWQVKAYVRDLGRDRHVFTDELIEQLSEREEVAGADVEKRLALRDCLKQVPGEQIELLRRRYEESLPTIQIAKLLNRTDSSVRSSLMRIRRALMKCINQRLAESS